MWSPLWSILLCKIPQLFAKSYLFGQLISLFQKKDTMRLPKIHIMFCPTVGAKYPFVQAPAHDITTKKQDEWSRVQSNIQWLIICRFLSQLGISTRYTELQLYEKFQLVLKIFQHRLKYGVIHIARTHNGGGDGSSQMRAIACKGGGGLVLVIFVGTCYVNDPYNSFEKQDIQKANVMKEQNKKNKNAF